MDDDRQTEWSKGRQSGMLMRSERTGGDEKEERRMRRRRNGMREYGV